MTINKLTIIQARMSSSRLPGKVLMEIAGRPMLQHVIQRALKAEAVDVIVVATTTDTSDDILDQFCQKQAVPCYRGSLTDVLDRYYHAAVKFQADVIIRLTADCPLMDPDLIDLTLTAFFAKPLLQDSLNSPQSSDYFSPTVNPFHFAANRLPPPWKRTLPIGLDVEVCSFDALERAWREADQPYQREHVMPYLYEGVSFLKNPLPDSGFYVAQGTSPRSFRVALLNHLPDYGSLRWTVDTPADLEFVRQVFSRFESQDGFGWRQVLALLEKEPDLASINSEVKHNSAFDVDERSSHP